MTTTNTKESEIPFVAHLIELRDRLLRVVLVVLVIFVVLFYFANDVYSYLAEPLLVRLAPGSTMIATDVISPFLTPMKLALVLSIFLVMPYILYHIWSFIAPGLYKHEKELARPLLVSSIILFYSGMAFAYYVVFPLVFGFIAAISIDGVNNMPDIKSYLDFVLVLFFAFGAAFEVPIATVILVATGLTTPDKLVEKRAYIIVAAFVLGMFLTPPDVISQIMLAIPMWMLFELGVVASRMVV
ncbi:MAG: twin-arginine translocase subunit TatC, partial [Gammaproteobacteria bacterium]